MALQLAESVRNAILDAIETDVGTSAKLKIWSGAQPASCATANSGTELAHMDLPSDWMNTATTGSKTKLGTWEEASAIATGTAGHFRVYKSDGTTCVAQGSVTGTGGGGDMEMDNTSITVGQTVTITAFTFNAGNA
jgi:hypothetical protein